MKVANIADLNLNDSVIIQTTINSDYEIEILIDYVVDYASQKTVLQKIVFRDCLSCEFQCHLAFKGPNPILSGHETCLENGYRKFTIETNTTSSRLVVSAKTLELLPAQTP